MQISSAELPAIRIVLIGHFPLEPDGFAGGIESSTSNLLEGLTEFHDLELHVLSLTAAVNEPYRVARNGVQFHYLPVPSTLNTLTLHRRSRQVIRKEVKNLDPDVVHALDALDSGYSSLKALRDRPVVVSIHGIVREELKYVSSLRDYLRTAITSYIIERYCVRHATHLIAPTTYPQRYFAQQIKGKITAVPNAISMRYFSQGDVEEDPYALIYSGAIIPRKRLLDLVEAIALVKADLPRVTLTVAGGTPDSAYLTRVKNAISAHGLRETVRVLGPVKLDQLVREYRRSAVLVLPSAQETSPMVIGELMALGKPVVATNVGGVPELVDDGRTGFVIDCGDVPALADRIMALLRDPALRAEMGGRGKEKAVAEYAVDGVAAKVRRIYADADRSASA